MGALDGGIRATFAQAFGAVYLSGVLTRVTLVEDGFGGYTRTTTGTQVKAQLDNADKIMRESPGFTDTDMKIIILQQGVSPAPTTDDEITLRGTVWQIARIRRDPADSHWIIHGKVKR